MSLRIVVRKSEDRGHANEGWLKTWHTFSFASYRDPRYMGFHTLRVINEDRVMPGQGFATHPHRDMEIVTVVLSGALRHEDSMGNGSIIKASEVQRMSAGTGVTHSEFNASDSEEVHLLQIWIRPSALGLNPGYEQKHFPKLATQSGRQLLVSKEGREGSVSIQQDVDFYRLNLIRDRAQEFILPANTALFAQVTQGEVNSGGHKLKAGDGLMVDGQGVVTFATSTDAEVLLIHLLNLS